MLISKLVDETDIDLPWFRDGCQLIGEPPTYNRKQWEFAYIIQALKERDMLAYGRYGIGFGVGKEPLAAVFASLGCHILATDQPITEETQGWSATGQQAQSLSDLNARGLCGAADFARRVQFAHVDMNHIPSWCGRNADFTWSSGSLEHLGSLEHGIQFLHNQMECLKPGGIAVHTTEYNVRSNDATINEPHLCLYRQQDIERLVAELHAAGHEITVDYTIHPTKHIQSIPAAYITPHLWLDVEGHTTTSIGLIIKKHVANPTAHTSRVHSIIQRHP